MAEPSKRPPRADWAQPPSPEERAAQLAEEERLVTRDIRAAYLRALLGCVASVLIALGFMGWALHTTDPGWGQIAFLTGLLLGYSGLVLTLARTYLRGQDQGWWE